MKKKKNVNKIILMMLNDIFFVLGALFIIGATYRINLSAGLYVTGIFLLIVAFILSYKPKGGG